MSDTTEKKVLLTVTLEVKQMIADLAVTKQAIQDLKDSQKSLGPVTDENRKQYEAYGAEIRSLTSTSKAQQAQIDNTIKSDNAKIDSVKQLKATLANLTAEYAGMSKEERKSADGKELQNSIKDTNKELTSAKNGTKSLSDIMSSMPGPIGNVSKAMTAFNATNPLGWIMLVIGAFTGWLSIMNKNADFAKGYQKVMAGISAVFESLSGYVIKVTFAIADFFKGVKDFPDLMSKIGNAIEENLINRLKSVGVLFSGLVDIMSGNFLKGGKEVLDGLSGIGTGVLNMTDKLGVAAKDISDKAKKAMDWGALLVDNEKKLAKMNTNATESMAKLEVIIEEGQAKIGKLGTMGATREEREAAFKIVEDAENKKIALQIDIANQELKISKLKRDKELADTGANFNATLQDVATKNAALIKLQGELDLKLQEIKMRKVKSDAQFLTEAITYLQNNAKTEKAIEQEKLKQSDLSIDEKQKSIDKIHQIDNDSYAAQIKALSDFSGKKIDVDSLMNESDTNKALQMIKNFGLTKTAETELIKLLNDRKTNLIQTNKDEIQFNRERTTQLVSDLQKELQLHQLHEKEVNAGKQLSHQQEIDELVSTYINEQKQLDAKHEAELISEEEYDNSQKALDQKFNTDKAVSDATFEAKQRSLKANQLSNELTDLVGNLDLQNNLKHQQLEAQMTEELKVANLTEEQIKAIREKYARESASLDLDTTKQKVENVLKYVNAISGALNGINELQKQIEAGQLQDATDANDQKKKDLDARLKAGTISQKQHDDQVAKSDEELDKKKRQIAHDQAVREKELNVFKTIINTASAVVAALPNVALSILAGVTGGIELATILATPLPKASRGLLLNGPSHAMGGIPIEAEGGEAIINKRSTAMFAPILSALNVAGGGVAFAPSPRFVSDGGFSARSSVNNSGVSKAEIQDAMEKAVAKIKVVSTIEDIRKADKNYSTIQDRQNF